MTCMKTFLSATAIVAAGAIPAIAQTSGDDVTAEDLGVDTTIEGLAAQNDATATDNAQTQQGEAMTAESEYSDEKLDAFVTTALEMRELRESYAQQIADAADEEAAQALVLEAQAEMVAVIENADDITPEEYQAIGQAAQTDPELANRLVSMFEAEMGEEPAGEEEDQS